MVFLKLWDMTADEFRNKEDGIYYDNINFFKKLKSCFYFASRNKRAYSTGAAICGTRNGDASEFVNPKHGASSIALLYEANEDVLENVRVKCAEWKDGRLGFNLKNKAGCYMAIVLHEGKEHVGIAIENKTKLPFSNNGKSSYDEAKYEEGTLPYMVENNKFVELMPEKIMKLLGIEPSLKFKDVCSAAKDKGISCTQEFNNRLDLLRETKKTNKELLTYIAKRNNLTQLFKNYDLPQNENVNNTERHSETGAEK